MPVPRQGGSSETGRVNQKRRTRAAIVEAAKAIIATGTTPTVAQAAEQALVSRTTAYRYFPTQESLLLEITVTADVADIEALVAEPVDAGSAPGRAVEVLSRFNRNVLTEEVRYRTAMRLYLDLWLAGVAGGDPSPMVREGRRRRWLETTLAPLADQLDDDRFARLVSALCLTSGAESMYVLQDIAGLDPDDATAVAAWVARTLIGATLDEPG